MSLVERLKNTVTGESEDHLFRYHCRNCDNEFEVAEVHTSKVSCPGCGDGENITKL